jgi:hypothetical protein
LSCKFEVNDRFQSWKSILSIVIKLILYKNKKKG